jgi:aspartate racemase
VAQPDALPPGATARRVVGVLGGMGPAAAAYFCLRLVQETAAGRDQDHVHVILDNDPSVPDRTEFLLGRGDDPTPALVTMAQRLEKAGADLLVMACNSASPFTGQVAATVQAPLVDWAGEAATAALSRDQSVSAVGLLATAGTVRSGIYQQRLAAIGGRAVVPSPGGQELVSSAIYDIKAGRPGSAEPMLEVARELAAEGAAALLVACTELSLLFAGSRADWPVPVTDALEAVARRTITLAGGSVRAESFEY